MTSAVAELETGLQGMLALKPPGVSGSRITTITALCVANVQVRARPAAPDQQLATYLTDAPWPPQSESVLIQKIYTHFKKTPATHKLGVLYVVDSVTRKWMDQARQQGQAVNSAAVDGSFAAGVNKVTELMPVLMNDITASAPADQKVCSPATAPPTLVCLPACSRRLSAQDKIRKLVDIWEKGQTFPTEMLESFKKKLLAPPPPPACRFTDRRPPSPLSPLRPLRGERCF